MTASNSLIEIDSTSESSNSLSNGEAIVSDYQFSPTKIMDKFNTFNNNNNNTNASNNNRVNDASSDTTLDDPNLLASPVPSIKFEFSKNFNDFHNKYNNMVNGTCASDAPNFDHKQFDNPFYLPANLYKTLLAKAVLAKKESGFNYFENASDNEKVNFQQTFSSFFNFIFTLSSSYHPLPCSNLSYCTQHPTS